MNAKRSAAFTLVELLVVISIIVILLAILVPSLGKAMRASEKSKCAANQRNIAQVITGYALNNRYVLVPSVLTATRTTAQARNPVDNSNIGNPSGYAVSAFAFAMDYRGTDQASAGVQPTTALPAPSRPLPITLATALSLPLTLGSSTSQPPPTGAGSSGLMLGLGILVQTDGLPTTKLGEIAHCPSLNTEKSAISPGFGMDQTYAIAAATSTNGSDTNGAGGSYIADPNQKNARIVGSYNYRGTSWAFTHGGAATIQYSQIGPGFALLSDFTDPRFGRKFHHRDGYNVAYGDGHCSYFEDPAGLKPADLSTVEEKAQGKPIDGHSAPQQDEAIWEHFATQRPKK